MQAVLRAAEQRRAGGPGPAGAGQPAAPGAPTRTSTAREGFDVPDEMAEAQDNLLLVLNLRADGDRARSPTRSPPRRAAARPRAARSSRSPAQMQAFLASDVVYSQRVVAAHQGGARRREHRRARRSRRASFLRDLAWLNPDVVGGAPRLGVGRRARAARSRPGLHGHGLESVAVGDVDAAAAAATNRVPAAGGVTFTVDVGQPGRQQRVRRPRDGDASAAPGKPITVNKTVAADDRRSRRRACRSRSAQSPPVGQADDRRGRRRQGAGREEDSTTTASATRSSSPR